MDKGFTAPIWMTFRQATELNAHVRKGEKGSLVVYANSITRTEEDDNGEETEREIHYMKGYTVFNVEQIEGLPEHYYGKPEVQTTPVERIATPRHSSRRPKPMSATVATAPFTATTATISRCRSQDQGFAFVERVIEQAPSAEHRRVKHEIHQRPFHRAVILNELEGRDGPSHRERPSRRPPPLHREGSSKPRLSRETHR